MAAIVRTESQFNPLAININAKVRLERQPSTKAEAIQTAKWLLANNYNIDMGLGQVNSANMRKTYLSIEDAFDPCKNIAAAAKILQSNYVSASKRTSSEQQALRAALSAYNTGSYSRGFANGYVQKVVNNAGVKERVATKNTVVVNEKKSKKVITSMAVPNKETSESGWFIAVAPVTEGDVKSNFSSSPQHGNVIIF
jgi:type IV secretion system protein VirB1